MKNAFGATFLIQIVIVFVVIFTGYICLSINQAKAFNVKNEIVKTIERYAPNFDTDEFKNAIAETMEREGYRLEGDCSRLEGDYVGYERDGSLDYTGDAAFCIMAIPSTIAGGFQNNGNHNAVYYKVVTFYQLEIPIIRSLFNLKATGETKLIYNKDISF